MKRRVYLFFGLLVFCLLLNCKREVPQTQMAFYHWQTRLSIDSLEQQWLTQTHSERLYVKFFDVDWDYTQQAAIPKAELILTRPPEAIAIVPTVFITNRCFQEITDSETSTLASSIFEKINALWPDLNPPEIQIDCDWTVSTRDLYFTFLEQFKSLLRPATELSATIRLHQYRYPTRTGIPPVDRGMLMYYNMGELTDWTETNSILNLDKAAPYLKAEAYPLILDLALPLFRWGVLFREGHMIKLINGLSDVSLTSDNFEQIAQDKSLGSSRWLVTEGIYLNGYYLYPGDQLRLEYVTTKLLEKAASQLKSIPPISDRYLSFYHLNNELLDRLRISPANLNAILGSIE